MDDKDKKEWYKSQWVIIVGMFLAVKLFGPLETIMGFVTYYFLQTRYGSNTAFWIALLITVLSTIFFGIYLNTTGIVS